MKVTEEVERSKGLERRSRELDKSEESTLLAEELKAMRKRWV